MKTKEFASVEVWVLVDEDGNYAVGTCAESVAERYTEEIGSSDSTARRCVKVTMRVPLPETVEVEIEVPENGDSATVVVK